MKICVVGAGAIGGLMGVKLALAGEDVTLIDVGAHLDAIKKNGLKVIAPDGSEEVADNFVKVTSNMAEAGEQICSPGLPGAAGKSSPSAWFQNFAQSNHKSTHCFNI